MYTQTRKELSHLVRRLISLSPLVPKMAKNKKMLGWAAACPLARARPPAPAQRKPGSPKNVRVPEWEAFSSPHSPRRVAFLGRHDISAASSTIGRGVEVTGTAVVICVIA